MQQYEHFRGFFYTDGIRYLADHGNCYWLIDLVGSYQHRFRNVSFQLWEIAVNQDSSALVTMAEDLGREPLVRQAIPWTDFRLRRLSFYCVDRVMMLKSEY